MSTNSSASQGIITARATSNRNNSHGATSTRECPDSQATHCHQNANGATAQSKYSDGATAERKNAPSKPAHGQPTSRYITDRNNPASVTAKFTPRQIGPRSDRP